LVRTSTAEKHGYRCPECGDELSKDKSGIGHVRHKSNPDCRFEVGQRDTDGSQASVRANAVPHASHEPSDGVRICGYSERGIFNSLLYEIGFASNSFNLIQELLELIRVPTGKPDLRKPEGAEVLIEQSLSDFGDADAIVLLHGQDWRCAVFIEGKVKPSQIASWSIQGAWDDFLRRKSGTLESSNLFTQLYHKVCFVSALRTGGIEYLQSGVEFPACSTKQTRKLGSNPVVVRAAEMIQAYKEHALYIAVVPDDSSKVKQFFEQNLARGPATDVLGWDTSGWGYLCWHDVEAFCKKNEMTNTLRVFKFNEGQIY